MASSNHTRPRPRLSFTTCSSCTKRMPRTGFRLRRTKLLSLSALIACFASQASSSGIDIRGRFASVTLWAKTECGDLGRSSFRGPPVVRTGRLKSVHFRERFQPVGYAYNLPDGRNRHSVRRFFGSRCVERNSNIVLMRALSPT